ncbi:ribbon-helix-helix protein, CopG family [Sulfitobacter sp. R18_1]|jgi:metal-responsive CopG/Arc/MetJ family transcriptional regulator|nr:ribbon-helix-helix protein, CopG family [Sulfitobacter sp. R18_1]
MVKKGRPPVDSSGIMLRLHNDIIKKIDNLRKEEDDLPTRPEMIRRMIRDWIENNENMK